MKIIKLGSLEFVDLDSMDMMKLGLMDLVACGSHQKSGEKPPPFKAWGG